MLIKNSAEGGTNGTSVTTGNSGGTSGSAFNSVNIGTSATVAFDNTRSAHGNMAYSLGTGGTASAADVEWTTSAGSLTTVYGRFYFYATAAPGAQHRLLTIATSGGAALNSSIYWSTSRTLLMTDSAANAILTSSTLAANTWHRIEFKVVQSATVGLLELKVFSGTNMDGTTPDYSGTSAATQNTGSSAMALYSFGSGFDVKANITTFWLDDLGLSDTGYLGSSITTSSWINRTVLSGSSVNANGTTSHTCSFTPATSGNFLVAIVGGAVTSTTPSGWTLVTSAINNCGLYVFTKTASAGESSFSTTHNGSDYAIQGIVYEFYAGTSAIGSNSATALGSGTQTGPQVTGLSGTYTTFAARTQNDSSGITASSTVWTTPAIEDYDVLVSKGANDGVYLTIAYEDSQGGPSFNPSATLSTNVGTTQEAIAFALSVTTPPMYQVIRTTTGPVSQNDDAPNHTITVPSTIAAGDILIIFAACDDNPPTSLTMPGGSPTPTTIVMESATSWPNGGASYVGPLSSADVSALAGNTITCPPDGASLCLVVLQNAAPLIDFVTPAGGNYTSSLSQSIPSATTTDNGVYVFAMFNGGCNPAGAFGNNTWTTPSGWTAVGTANSSYESLGVFYKAMPTSGAIGTVSSSIALNSGTVERGGSFAFAFRNGTIPAGSSVIAWLTA